MDLCTGDLCTQSHLLIYLLRLSSLDTSCIIVLNSVATSIHLAFLKKQMTISKSLFSVYYFTIPKILVAVRTLLNLHLLCGALGAG